MLTAWLWSMFAYTLAWKHKHKMFGFCLMQVLIFEWFSIFFKVKMWFKMTICRQKYVYVWSLWYIIWKTHTREDSILKVPLSIRNLHGIYRQICVCGKTHWWSQWGISFSSLRECMIFVLTWLGGKSWLSSLALMFLFVVNVSYEYVRQTI